MKKPTHVNNSWDRALEELSIPIISSKTYNPKVTIAIPTYKRPASLKRALDSALSQTDFDDYEVLIVDNNPNRFDETEKLIRSYSSNQISYYKNSQNIGMIGNWNKVYQLAKGEWIVMLHDDDEIFSDFLCRIFNQHWKKISKFDVIYPCFTTETKDETQFHNRVFKNFYVKLHMTDFVVRNIVGPPLGFTIKKDNMCRLKGFNENFYPSADAEFFRRALAEGLQCVKIYGRPFAYYNTENNESSHASTIIGFLKIGSKETFRLYRHKMNPIIRWLRTSSGNFYYSKYLRLIAGERFINHPLIQSELSSLENNSSRYNRLMYKIFILSTNYFRRAYEKYFRRKKLS